MAGRAIVDTNILLYAYDKSEPVKQPRALDLLDQLVTHGLGVLTSQVLAEFFVNATRKLRPPLSVEAAYRSIENYLLAWEILDVTGPIVLEAARGVRDYGMSYWDAQIWASARMNQIPVILSEDFDEGAATAGVRFVNPFSRDFDLKAWLPGSKVSK